MMKKSARPTPGYLLGGSGEFVIEHYNEAKPFASFFPGIAGPHGIPMWAFYVNRGQCVCSMGIEDKEHPIMEFLSANAAYQLTSVQGFRTFIKLQDGRRTRFYEPFQQRLSDEGMNRVQRMIILPAQLTLEEVNRTLGLQFTIDYFNVPEDSYAGLIRVLRIRNLSRRTARLQFLDGLPLIIPFGVDNYNLKHMRRLVESFVEVINYERGVPYFKGKVKQEDRPEIMEIKEGNFYAGFVVGPKGSRLATPIVDPQWIFGSLTDFSYPERFLAATPFRIKPGQILENRLPCAMGLASANIPAGGTFTYCSIIGSTSTVEELNRLVPRITRMSYVERKQRQNADLIEQLTQNNFTASGSGTFDLYCRQNFLDNTLRGGLPVSLSGNGSVTTLHLYSRKHGDLERDYNDYRLSPTNYSQGNGNFRDVNQNRRNDLFLNPDVRESSVEHFHNLIQLDGFNPLVVKPTSFSVKNHKVLDRILRKSIPSKYLATVREFFGQRFSPGQLMSFLAERRIRPSLPPDDFVGQILAVCSKHQEIDVGHGYWSDHWTYNLDLLENYLAVYPENLRYVLLEKKSFTFFDNPHRVLPRDDKYVVWDGRLMQLGSVVGSPEKEQLIRQRTDTPYEVRTRSGKGDIYHTTLLGKLVCLVANKLASLDPFGVGIEMESDKPNWYDALNGLPGQLGSSISETLELKRLMLFILDSLRRLNVGQGEACMLFAEAEELVDRLHRLMKEYFGRRDGSRDFDFWDRASSAKEEYREKTRLGIAGGEKAVRMGDLRDFLELAVKKLDLGIAKAWDRKRKILYTYFINKVVQSQPIVQYGPGGTRSVKRSRKGLPCFRALKFKQVPLPLFLEGPVHFLRIEHDAKNAADLVRRIRNSGLYDRKLKMYKVNESLEDQPMEIGRTRTFSRGWLENESIWLHMEYKYLLELLRCGLHRDFYQDMKTMLVPFLKPEVYGRSILENSSFIASSANPDVAVHGNGFVARLSGSTAEWIHILLLMTVGEKPFRVNTQGDLELQFRPALPAWLFTRKPTSAQLWIDGERRTVRFPANTFSFFFLGSTLVTFHNPRRRDTFGERAVQPRAWTLTHASGPVTRIEGNSISGLLARQVRERKIRRIEIELG
ncbi:MAG: hypothetical protein V1873_06865 [Verrucomicrobiota bacterium]